MRTRSVLNGDLRHEVSDDTATTLRRTPGDCGHAVVPAAAAASSPHAFRFRIRTIRRADGVPAAP